MAAEVWAAWDALCTEGMRTMFVWLGFEELLSPPASSSKDLPFVSSPTVLVTCILVYLTVVCGSLVSSALSKKEIKRDSFLLRAFVQLHNIFLVGLSLYMCTGILYQAVANGYSFWGNNFNPSEKRMAEMIHIFYVSKMYEFIDTFIMILKGNMRQVSLLHVYHHLSISMIWWSIVYVAPGGDAYYSAALNSFVHVVMYTYYFLASAIGKNDKARKRYLWWGKYLTQLQMTQFVTMLFQATYNIKYKRYNSFLAQLLIVYMLSLLALFGNFYVQKYSQTHKGMKIKTSATKVDGNVLDGEVSPDSGMKIKSG